MHKKEVPKELEIAKESISRDLHCGLFLSIVEAKNCLNDDKFFDFRNNGHAAKFALEKFLSDYDFVN